MHKRFSFDSQVPLMQWRCAGRDVFPPCDNWNVKELSHECFTSVW